MSPHHVHHPTPTRSRKLLLWRLLGVVAWVLIVCWLSLTSHPPRLPGIWGWDKLHHALAYGLLALLVARFLGAWLVNRGSSVLVLVWVATVIYGVLLEYLQDALRSGRTAEFNDLVANGLGALAVCVLLSHRKLASLYRV